jgi:hypothetical protein
MNFQHNFSEKVPLTLANDPGFSRERRLLSQREQSRGFGVNINEIY